MIAYPVKKLICLSSVIFLCSCASSPFGWGERTNLKIKDELRTAKSSSSLKTTGLPEGINFELLPPLQIDLPQTATKPVTERFDLAIKNANAKDVYMNLVKDTGYSITIEPSVSGKVSLQLSSVSLEDVFNHMQNTFEFYYEKRGRHFHIYDNSIRSKIFHVDYLSLIREGASQSQVTSGGISETSGQGVSIKTSNSVRFWEDLILSLKSLIGDEEGRKVAVNQHSGFIVINATPSELSIVEKFLNQLEDNVSRQVILEAKLLEVELHDTFQSGINWGKIASVNGNSVTLSQTGGGTSLAGGNITGNQGNTTTDIIGSPVNALGATAFGGVFSMAVQGSNFGAFIELIKSQGDVHVLSSPRISAINNQKAVIKVGGEEFYITSVKQENDDNNTNNNNDSSRVSVELETFFSGIALDVTPQIDDEGNINLHLHPTVSDVQQKNKTFILSGEGFELPLAASTVRETDTVVRAKSGQIIVVGGLMKEATTDTQTSVPFLGDLPLIGGLFRHKSIVRVKKELVVLVKPTLVRSGGQWDAEAANSFHRFSGLEH